MKKIITKYYCDVCHTETDNYEEKIQVIFETEQNEGKKCKPYLEENKLNLCDKCKNKILYGGKYIFAFGAMGSNKYFFKGDE